MNYVTTHLLGKGSYGKVYRAMSEDRTFHAIKICDLYEKNLQICRGTLREYVFYRSIEPHPNIVKASCRKNSETAFFCMPLYSCDALYAAKHTVLSYSDFLIIARDVQNALLHLHSRGWMHRDIKPENVYLHAKGAVLGDYNLVRLHCTQEIIDSEHLCKESTTNICTLWSRAPELLKAAVENRKVVNVNYATDVFSFCITLLSIAHGNWIYGRRVKGEGNTSEEKHLDAYKELEDTSCILKYLPTSWKQEERAHIAEELAKGLELDPGSRCSLQSMQFRSEEDKFSTSLQFVLDMALEECKPHNKVITLPSPSLSLKCVDSDSVMMSAKIWHAASAIHLPSFLSFMCMRSFRRMTLYRDDEAKHVIGILCILRYFPDPMYEHMNLWDSVERLQYKMCEKDAGLFSKSFRSCIHAASIAYNKDSSETLLMPGVGVFFHAYGRYWGSQIEMLQSWRRST